MTAAQASSGDGLFSFPDPVNEVAARLVATGVVLMGLTAILLRQPWILLPLAYGFVARVLTGPTLSPLGQLVTRFIAPALPFAPKYVPGPPKRFAQGMGAVITVTGAVLYFGFDQVGAAYVLLGALVVAATLESAFAICLGCQVFAVLMRLGLIPADVCAACNEPTWLNAASRR